MFKTKLLAAALALGLSGMASASITGGSSGNTEFVFSAFADGKGYTFDLSDAGWNTDTFGANVKMNSLIGSTNTASLIGTTLVANPANGVLFDLALPSFDTFMSGVTASNIKWNVISAEVSGIRRIVQTVSSAPVAALTNTQVLEGAALFDQYVGAVNSKGTNVGGDVLADGVALTVVADGTSYAGLLGGNLGGKGYGNNGDLNAVMDMYVVSSKTTTASTTAARFAALTSATGQIVRANVYAAADGYHLQISAVPEPSSYAMLLAGLGMLGFVARRNRRV